MGSWQSLECVGIDNNGAINGSWVQVSRPPIGTVNCVERHVRVGREGYGFDLSFIQGFFYFG